ncbi:hypothetical protein EJ08DRAFT_731375 [Tothia fuscella]|uniref:Uncharacterized protein n=1 Tax=Tothia fuscella TaxID=1048955 RepID=A0A9P4U2C2_9PEZI|nr:hypothetical protein EJ08DRAFT_731375 [Tothia fuscella]
MAGLQKDMANSATPSSNIKSTETDPKKTFPFLRLARELRDMIYTEALVDQNGVIEATQPIILLRVNRQIYHESREILVKLIKYRVVELSFDDNQRIPQHMIFFLGTCPHLKITTTIAANFRMLIRQAEFKTLVLVLYRPSYLAVNNLIGHSNPDTRAMNAFSDLQELRVSESARIEFPIQPWSTMDDAVDFNYNLAIAHEEHEELDETYEDMRKIRVISAHGLQMIMGYGEPSLMYADFDYEYCRDYLCETSSLAFLQKYPSRSGS